MNISAKRILRITLFLSFAACCLYADAPKNSAASDAEIKQNTGISSQTAVAPDRDNPDAPRYIENLEIPLCRSDALFITEDDTKGVLDTFEKEDTHQIIHHSGFTLCYRERYEQAEWVAYTLNHDKIQKNVKRRDSFRPDPAVLTRSANLEDYKNSGFDRGHLAPCADLTYSKESMDDSFYMSNMSPQRPGFNRDSWKDLEHQMRVFADDFDMLWIVTGPVLEKDDYETIGENDVAVPEYYYKAVLAVRGDKYYAIGFIMPNKKCPVAFWEYAVPVDEVEKRTGLDFFYLLEDDVENNIESSFDYYDWFDEICDEVDDE